MWTQFWLLTFPLIYINLDLHHSSQSRPAVRLKMQLLFSPTLQIQQVKLTVKLAYTSTKVAICKHTLP